MEIDTRSPTLHPCMFGNRISPHKGSAPSTRKVTYSGWSEFNPRCKTSVTLPSSSSFFVFTVNLGKQTTFLLRSPFMPAPMPPRPLENNFILARRNKEVIKDTHGNHRGLWN